MSAMTRKAFKQRWESNANGGGITFNDIAECAKAWGLFATPRIHPMGLVTYRVLKAADTTDAESYKPEDAE
jgi:hypothetical protein